MSISCVNIVYAFPFVIASAGFDSLLIYLISIISRRLYTCQRLIISIIRRFSYIVPSYIRQLYNDFKSVYKVSGILIYRIWLIVDLIIILISNLQAILYNSKARMLYIILLYLTKLQQMILAWFVASISVMIYPIYNKRSLLFIKDISINMTSYRVLISNLTNLRPRFRFQSYQARRLFNSLALSSIGLITQAAKERSNNASS